MASRRYRNGGPSRSAAEPESYPVIDDVEADKNAIDRLMQQAISYLARASCSGSPAPWVENVQNIDNPILKKYREEGHTFDRGLYRQLRGMVCERQGDIERIFEEESSVSAPESDPSMQELLSPEALYRGNEEDVQYVEEPIRTPMAPLHQALSYPKIKDPLKKAEVYEMQFLYGGPNNEAEEWHKNLPPTLPFKETFYMQKWERMKTNHKLNESAKKQADESDPFVEMDIPYYSVKSSRNPLLYESGSRFKLPTITDRIWEIMKGAARKGMVAKVIEDFNQGPDFSMQVKKNYARRMFLHPLSLNRRHRDSLSGPFPSQQPVYKSSKALGKHPVRTPYTPTTLPEPSTPHKSIRKSFAGESVQEQIRNDTQRRPDIQPDDYPMGFFVPLKAGGLFSKQSGCSESPVRSPRASPEDKGVVRLLLSHVAAGPSTKRGPGRSRKNTPPTTTSTTSTTRAAAIIRKRKLTGAAGTAVASATKKAKTSPKTRTKAASPKAAASAKMLRSRKVAFADEETGPSKQPQTKSSPAKSGNKNLALPAGRAAAERKEEQEKKITPGQTRHGARFRKASR